jgi:sec-independent protein translocase protein TatA
MFSSFGYTEMLLFGVVALMLFGSKLPDVARSFGKGYREMRRKVDDLQREFRDWDKIDNVPPAAKSSKSFDEEAERFEPTAPKFVPPEDDSDKS